MRSFTSLVLSALCVGLVACGSSSMDSATSSVQSACSSCSKTLTGPINVPADDAVHAYSQYTDEWYYYSTHLETEDGRKFGFAQIFYTSLDPSSGNPIQYVDSTLSNHQTKKYSFGGRQYNPTPATVIANGFNFAVGTEKAVGGNGRDVVHSEIVDGSTTYVLDLTLTSTKTPVFHLADGSVNYYSRERMFAEGSLKINGKVEHVSGYTWFDHQFGPQLIDLSTVQNWTWIAVQFQHDEELLALIINKQDGSNLTIGSYTDPKCETTQLGAGDFTITALGTWSPSTSCTYPMNWRVKVPSKKIDLTVRPVFEAQDIWVPTQDHYYEGDATATGSAEGNAYVELYGFCAP